MADCRGDFTDLLYRTYDFQNFESRTLSYGISLRLIMENELVLKNNLKEARSKKQISQRELAEMVGLSSNTISSIETGQFNPTAKLALIICIALDKKFEELFYF